MKEMQVFNNDDFGEVRTVMRDGEPWFVAADVCRVLEIANATQALERLESDERAMFSIGRQGETNIVNEYGLYSLILGSRKPEARKFKRWIIHEVLPSIRKYGVYAANGALSNPDVIAALILSLKHEQERGEKLQRRLNRLTSPAAQKAAELDDVPERSARLFMDALAEMLKSGEVRVADIADGEAEADDLIGFMDDDYLYTIPRMTYEFVARRCRAEGDPFSVSSRMLNKALCHMRYIEPDIHAGTATKVKWVAGRPRRLLWILRERM